MPPFQSLRVCLEPPLGVVKYSHDRRKKNKAPEKSCLMAVLIRYCCFLYIWSTSLAGIDLLCLVGGSTDFYLHLYRCRIRYFWSGAYRVELLQRSARKGADTSNTVDLTIPLRIFALFVVPNWFLSTNSENDDISVVFYRCGITSWFFSLDCVRNFYHLSQFPYLFFLCLCWFLRSCWGCW